MAEETGDIYFYSPEQLDGSRGVLGKRNLYVYRNGSAQFVASLGPSLGLTRINVSPDGRYAAFITREKLGAYNNGNAEMYRYNTETRDLICVSCMPDGSPSSSSAEGSEDGRFLTDDGRAFFATRDPLVVTDADGIRDVYEYADGRPQLISSGTGEFEGTKFQPNGLVGVTGDGTDAFFGTYDTLVGQDQVGPFLKFYDARVGGGFPFERPPAPCAAADECHGAGSAPPAALENGSGANLGSGGNAHPAKHHHRRKHHRKKHAKRHGRSRSQSRGARR
jgi:hypothetical protein